MTTSFNEEAFTAELYDDLDNGCIIKRHKLSKPCIICKTVTDWIVVVYNSNYMREYKVAGRKQSQYRTKFELNHVCSKECYESYKANKTLELATKFGNETNDLDIGF